MAWPAAAVSTAQPTDIAVDRRRNGYLVAARPAAERAASKALLGRMNHSRSPAPDSDATTAFRTQLGDVLFRAYARGATVETTHEIDGPATDAPGWSVTIEKRPPASRRYEPTLLEDESTAGGDADRGQ